MHHAYIDKYAGQDSPIHRLDPRIKTVAVLSYTILLVSVGKYDLSRLAPFAIFPVVLIAFGGIPLKFVLKHAIVVSPFILFVAIFNPVFEKSPVEFNIGSQVYIISAGWISMANIIIKFLLGVTALLGLATTTRFSDLLKALEWFRVPRILIMQLSFLYRYIFVLIDQIQRMFRARDSRYVGRISFLYKWQIGAGIVGTLFVRTLERAERIYTAMASRGFDGTVRTLGRFKIRWSDLCFLALSLAYCVYCRFGVI